MINGIICDHRQKAGIRLEAGHRQKVGDHYHELGSYRRKRNPKSGTAIRRHLYSLCKRYGRCRRDFKAGNDFNLPRLGLQVALNPTLEQVEWYGRGPIENYWDRKAGYMIGQYKSTAEEQYFPYVRPQENGHHCDTRWISLGGKGKNLLIVADDEMEFNAMRNSVEDSTLASNRPPVPVEQLHTGRDCQPSGNRTVRQTSPDTYQRHRTA